jgi:hypothetical protein
MSFRPTDRQKKILSLLLDKYENSLTYTGDNLVHQTFSITPERVYRKYDDDFEPQEKVSAFEKELDELEHQGLVTITSKDNVIKKITAIDGAIPEYYGLIGRREKRNIIRDEKAFYESCLGRDTLIDSFTKDQLERLSSGKRPTYELAEASDIVRLLERILHHDGELLERELSISVLGDSKAFGDRYRQRIVKLLEKYGDVSDEMSELYGTKDRQVEILADYGILANPSTIWIKGKGNIYFDDSMIMGFFEGRAVGLSSDTVSRVRNVGIASHIIMTVENLTSFNRLDLPDATIVYLGGYHNMIKEKFFSCINEKWRYKWFHFGDIDPDGFLIMERLKNRTGISFEPYHMGIHDLEKYRAYTKPLEKNDITKAHHLIERGLYTDIMKYMLDNNVKLEQEIISMQR